MPSAPAICRFLAVPHKSCNVDIELKRYQQEIALKRRGRSLVTRSPDPEGNYVLLNSSMGEWG